MTREKQNDSAQRDTTMARLVAAALESQTAKPTTAPCPDASLLAAYADHSLSVDETAQWESHFADCSRCQEILAVLTVSAEAPVTQQEIAHPVQVVGSGARPAESASPVVRADAPAARPQIVRPAAPRAPWRWLVPAFGVAAAVAFWFALRPVPPSIAPGTQIMAEKSAVSPPPGQQEQMAQANVPPQTAVSGRTAPQANAQTPALKSETETRSLDRETFSAANTPAKQKDALRDKANNEAANNGSLTADKKEASNAPAAEADQATPAATPPALGQQTQSVTVTAAPAITAGNAGARSGAVAETGAAAAPPTAALQAQAARQAPAPQPAAPSGSQLSAENGVRAVPLAGRNIAAMAKVATPPTIFGAPDRSAEWRIGSAGKIERSSDQGKTWQTQPSGVTSDLLAGVAVSDKIAWIVGRANVILRTTDGEHWQRTISPPATPVGATAGGGIAGGRVDALESSSSPDLASVQASDALHATITSADGRRYATANGGQTWAPQP